MEEKEQIKKQPKIKLILLSLVIILLTGCLAYVVWDNYYDNGVWDFNKKAVVSNADLPNNNLADKLADHYLLRDLNAVFKYTGEKSITKFNNTDMIKIILISIYYNEDYGNTYKQTNEEIQTKSLELFGIGRIWIDYSAPEFDFKLGKYETPVGEFTITDDSPNGYIINRNENGNITCGNGYNYKNIKQSGKKIKAIFEVYENTMDAGECIEPANSKAKGEITVTLNNNFQVKSVIYTKK